MPRTLIISDLHIGDPRYRENYVKDILTEETYDRLILNGDVVDLWLSNLKEINRDPLYRQIKKISEEKDVIWVLGNHDHEIRNEKNSKLLPHALITDTVTIDEFGKKTLIMHGHQVYKNDNRSKANILSGKINSLIWKCTRIDCQKLINASRFYKKYAENKRKKILEQYGEDFDFIIIGHTHAIDVCKLGITRLYDLGSAVETKSYAIIEDGMVWIKRDV